MFIGYPFGMKVYKLLDLESNKVVISRDVVFHESIFHLASKASSADIADFSLKLCCLYLLLIWILKLLSLLEMFLLPLDNMSSSYLLLQLLIIFMFLLVLHAMLRSHVTYKIIIVVLYPILLLFLLLLTLSRIFLLMRD